MVLDSKLLKNNISNYKFIVFDLETEGLNLCSSRPWEVAWDVYHGMNKKEEHQYYLKWPDLNVSKGAAERTGFNFEKVQKEGKDPKHVIDLFNQYLYNTEYKLVTTNGLGFDSYIHNVARLQLGYKSDFSYIKRMYDNDSLSRAYKLGIKVPENTNDFIAFQYNMSSIIQKGLKTNNAAMAREFGIEVDESKLHGANYDIFITFHVFLNLIKRMDIQ